MLVAEPPVDLGQVVAFRASRAYAAWAFGFPVESSPLTDSGRFHFEAFGEVFVAVRSPLFECEAGEGMRVLVGGHNRSKSKFGLSNIKFYFSGFWSLIASGLLAGLGLGCFD